jgi:hypothetical protein
MPVLKKWFTLREESYDPSSGSGLFKIQEIKNNQRRKGISTLMKSKPGIYLIGDSHIALLRKANQLP